MSIPYWLLITKQLGFVIALQEKGGEPATGFYSGFQAVGVRLVVYIDDIIISGLGRLLAAMAKDAVLHHTFLVVGVGRRPAIGKVSVAYSVGVLPFAGAPWVGIEVASR